MDYDYLIKLIVIGDSGVGKSAILLRYCDDIFSENYLSTIGVDFRIRTLNVDDKIAKLQLWDTAGQERFNAIVVSYFRGAHGVFIVYDVTNRESFENLNYHIDRVRKYCTPNIPIVIIGNKSDLEKKREISYEEAMSYAIDKQIILIETSAKLNKGIDDAMLELVRQHIKRPLTKIPDSNCSLKETTTINNRGCCSN